MNSLIVIGAMIIFLFFAWMAFTQSAWVIGIIESKADPYSKYGFYRRWQGGTWLNVYDGDHFFWKRYDQFLPHDKLFTEVINDGCIDNCSIAAYECYSHSKRNFYWMLISYIINNYNPYEQFAKHTAHDNYYKMEKKDMN